MKWDPALAGSINSADEMGLALAGSIISSDEMGLALAGSIISSDEMGLALMGSVISSVEKHFRRILGTVAVDRRAAKATAPSQESQEKREITAPLASNSSHSNRPMVKRASMFIWRAASFRAILTPVNRLKEGEVMPAKINIGEGSFRVLREKRSEYVDKTHFIAQCLEDDSRAVLLPRPRRFGKTLNLTMLYEFFARQEAPSEHLFEGLYIKDVWDSYSCHFRRYPTLFLTFKNLKPEGLHSWENALRRLISRSLKDQTAVYATLDSQDQKKFNALVQEEADLDLMAESFFLLSGWLERAHGEKVIILIDEYDTPIQEAWLATEQALRFPREISPEVLFPDGATLYKRVVNFFRVFFGSVLKDNPHLSKSVVTGILRVSQESIFSDLNNLDVHTVLDSSYSDAFGFTESEVVALFERQKQASRLDIARRWYNGYRFGPHTIYNPWSLMNFLSRPEKPPEAYWLNSSSNALIHYYLSSRALDYHDSFRALLEGQALIRPLETNLAFFQVGHSEEALYSLLFFSGYLKAELAELDYQGAGLYALSVPNFEVSVLYRRSFSTWLETQLQGEGRAVKQLTDALLKGDEYTVQHMLSTLVIQMMSFHDGLASQPEAIYHGLMLGLCAALEPAYRVRSNRETGFGRADLQIQPRRAGQAGAVLELKVARPEKQTLDQALDEGAEQIGTRAYVTELQSDGVSPIYGWVMAFDGKVVKVRKVGNLDLQSETGRVGTEPQLCR